MLAFEFPTRPPMRPGGLTVRAVTIYYEAIRTTWLVALLPAVKTTAATATTPAAAATPCSW